MNEFPRVGGRDDGIARRDRDGDISQDPRETRETMRWFGGRSRRDNSTENTFQKIKTTKNYTYLGESV
jgi:hypothetical protein